MALRGGEKMVAKLGRIARNVSTGKVLRVGFKSDALHPDRGIPVAMIAAVQNYGSYSQPPRPFFSNMIAENKDEWPEFMAEMRESGYDADERMRELGELIVEQLHDSIDNGDYEPLAEPTIMKKGHDQPLIHTGTMRDSVEWWLE